jgi:hypothetical protein
MLLLLLLLDGGVSALFLRRASQPDLKLPFLLSLFGSNGFGWHLHHVGSSDVLLG